MTTSSESAPIWLDGNGKIDEVGFCESFRESHPMLCIHETFFTRDGKVTDESRLKSEIYQMIKPYVRTGVSKKVNNLLEALRSECFSPPLPIYHDRIHVANGTLFLDGRFEESKDFCLNCLPVRYDPDAPRPERWLRFLDELLIPEDILTLQEFMGYCLIPSTKAQKMLMLVGKGGEGKSRVGIVLSALLGINMYSGSIAKVETSPFARADLEYGLLMVDDDMKMEALPDTNILKTLITAELPMDLEKKGKQSYTKQRGFIPRNEKSHETQKLDGGSKASPSRQNKSIQRKKLPLELLQKEIPDLSIFLFDTPDKNSKDANLTVHCLCGSNAAFTTVVDGVSCADWMMRGVSGEVLKLGFGLL